MSQHAAAQKARPPKNRAVPGCHPDRPGLSRLDVAPAVHLLMPPAQLTDREALFWDEQAASCCAGEPTRAIRAGVYRDGKGRLHVLGCGLQTARVISLAEAMAEAERG